MSGVFSDITIEDESSVVCTAACEASFESALSHFEVDVVKHRDGRIATLAARTSRKELRGRMKDIMICCRTWTCVLGLREYAATFSK